MLRCYSKVKMTFVSVVTTMAIFITYRGRKFFWCTSAGRRIKHMSFFPSRLDCISQTYIKNKSFCSRSDSMTQCGFPSFSEAVKRPLSVGCFLAGFLSRKVWAWNSPFCGWSAGRKGKAEESMAVICYKPHNGGYFERSSPKSSTYFT